jgi:hypothetical protein
MARYRILTWRDIPAQIKVYREGGRPLSVPLPEWYQQEIDRVAMRDGLVGTDEYLAQWQWSGDLEKPGTADEVAETVLAEIEGEWRSPEKSREI